MDRMIYKSYITTFIIKIWDITCQNISVFTYIKAVINLPSIWTGKEDNIRRKNLSYIKPCISRLFKRFHDIETF